jgi:hypothetical protein
MFTLRFLPKSCIFLFYRLSPAFSQVNSALVSQARRVLAPGGTFHMLSDDAACVLVLPAVFLCDIM